MQSLSITYMYIHVHKCTRDVGTKPMYCVHEVCADLSSEWLEYCETLPRCTVHDQSISVVIAVRMGQLSLAKV